jgi:type IX secretion system PorP/SprF family membrane protein
MGSSLHAQQLTLFNHYYYKPMVYNPAFTGNGDAPELMLINHTQWTGFKGGPQYNVLTFDGNAINKNTGLGITLLSDKKGVNSRIGGNISYSYKLRFKKENVYLLLGLSAGAISQSLDYSKAAMEDANDPSLFTNSQRSTNFDANAGLAFVYKRFELGISVPQLANNKLNYKSARGNTVSYTQARNYMSSVKYRFALSEKKDISLSPMALVRYTANTPLQYDMNLNLDIQNKFWIGATYKSNYALSANLGMNLFKHLSIAYSYDFITGSVGKYSGLSHEIMLGFKFIKPKKEPLTTEQQEDEELKSMASKDLNKLIIERLFKRIEEVLDKGNATPEEIQALLDEISSFFDSESTDPNQEILKKYYKSLKNQINGEFNVLVKGMLFLDGDDANITYAKVLISVTDLGTKKVVATSKPAIKDGKYYILLKPGKKYLITAECEGYKTYQKKFSPVGSVESYEMTQEIHLTR